MDRREILKAIQEEVKELVTCEISEDTVLTDIGDSLELTELVFKLEDKYDVSIPMNVRTVGCVIDACMPR
jgi:acyl carrier protein